VDIQLNFRGEDLVASKIVGHGERADDLRPAFRHVVRILEDVAEGQFKSEGGRASGGWATLAASTLRQKRAAGLDKRILHRTRRLGRPTDQIDVGTETVGEYMADVWTLQHFGTCSPTSSASTDRSGGGTSATRSRTSPCETSPRRRSAAGSKTGSRAEPALPR
jgi:hypothetical protein